MKFKYRRSIERFMDTKNVLIWGTGTDYDKYVNYFLAAELVGNIRILALVSREKQFKYLDNKLVISSFQIMDYKFDYIIVASERHYKAILQEAVLLGIDSKKLINGRVFTLPRFDFKRYIYILEGEISIISNNCWGGYAYHTLGIKSTSPFINLSIADDEYIELLCNLKYYMDQPLLLEKEGDETGSPIGVLGDKIKLNMVHYESFAKAKECWNRRIKRLNYDNIFVKMDILNDEFAEKFDRLPFKNKVGFYYKETKYDSIVCLNEFKDALFREKYSSMFRRYILNTAEINGFASKPYDILKLLCGEKDFIRKN